MIFSRISLNKAIYNILIFSILFFLSLFLPKLAYSNSILLDEDFDDQNSYGWIETLNATNSFWQVVSGEYRGEVVPFITQGGIFSSYGDSTWSDYIAEVDIRGLSGLDRHFFVRYDLSKPISERGYGVKYIEGTKGLSLYKSGIGVVASNSEFISNIGETHRLKFLMNGPNIQIVENNQLLIDYTDTTNPVLTGPITLYVQSSGSGYKNITGYDNIYVEDINSSPPLNLPIEYQGRLEDTHESANNFRETFWNRLNSSFDHQFEEGLFLNYLGTSYLPDECIDGLSCYDGHAGIDFSRFINPSINNDTDTNVYPAAAGELVYRSERVDPKGKSPVRCKPDPKGFGCIAIIQHTLQDYPDLYTLYAHLYEIYPNISETVDESEVLAQMGATGRATGRHLHFSVFEGDPANNIGLNAFKSMNSSDWETLSQQIAIDPSPSYCTYTAPNGLVFHPVDPSGWDGEGVDPWLTSCGKENKLLWRYPLTQ